MVNQLLNSYALTLDFLRRLVADLDDAQMVQQRHGIVNHPAWTIGHLVYSAQAMAAEIALPPWLPPDWGRRFATGSTPLPDPTAYPGKAALLRALVDAQQRLASALSAMSEADLARPLPDARYRNRIPTIGHALLHILTAHTAMHVGQLTTWRRAMGLNIVREPLNDG